jgi:TIR domain
MKIFLCYRRADSQHVSDRLYEELTGFFGRGSVFKDVYSIPLGHDFRETIGAAVSKCDVLIAIIGEEWLALTNENGERRIDMPNDSVRIEIETALNRGIRVIPVVVDRASMPRPEQLPSTLETLAFRQKCELRAGIDFKNDIERLRASITTGPTEPLHFETPAEINRSRLQYYCYISRSKVAQLSDQLIASDADARLASKEFLSVMDVISRHHGLEFGSRTFDTDGRKSTVVKLQHVVETIEKHEKILNLNQLCKDKAGIVLDAFCYAYRGHFYCIGEIGDGAGIRANRTRFEKGRADPVLSQEMLIEPGKTENAFPVLAEGNMRLVSNIAILCSEIEGFTLRLACSYKYFSSMGGSYDHEAKEIDASPHSGNYHFFSGSVDAWLEGLIFINGMKGMTIFGTPLYLVHAMDSGLRL